jgi:hypothetical protein
MLASQHHRTASLVIGRLRLTAPSSWARETVMGPTSPRCPDGTRCTRRRAGPELCGPLAAEGAPALVELGLRDFAPGEPLAQDLERGVDGRRRK